MLLDLDHFKQLNDVYGHERGNEALAAVGQTLASVARASDFAGRYGGEEFVMIVSGLGQADAVAAAERLRTAIELDDSEPRVTASFGVAAVSPPMPTTPRPSMEAADTALYSSKREGRNRVTAAGSLRVDELAEQPEGV